MNQETNSAYAFKGFLYQTKEGDWVLCNTPNLRSCCLTQHTIVHLDGDFSKYRCDKAIQAKGSYSTSTNTLSSVTIHQKNHTFPYGTVGALLLIILVWKRVKGLKKHPPLP